MIEFLQAQGYWGMLVAAFLAGSVVPFNSEMIMLGLQLAGLDPWLLLLYGSVGNVAGSMFNYGLGRLGRMDWIERYLKLKPEKLRKAQQYVERRGAWIAIFAFVPLVGNAITVALGLMRANPWMTCLFIAIGKVGRYALILAGGSLF